MASVTGGHATVVPIMIDIRLVREDPDAVKAALARRGVDPAEVDRLLELDAGARDGRGRAATSCGAEVKELSKQVGEARKAGDDRRWPRSWPSESRAARRRGARPSTPRPRRPRPRSARPCCTSPTSRRRRPRRGRARGQRGPGAGPTVDPDLQPRPSGCPTGRSAPRSASSTWSAGPSCPARCSRSTGASGPACSGPSPPSPSTATPTPSRRSARPPWCAPRPWSRPATCPSSPTTPTTSSATTCGPSPPPRSRSPRCSGTRSSTRRPCPLRLTAATACFRREAGSAGRDTRGLLRVHEFDKVELFAYATPDQAPADPRRHGRPAPRRLLQELGLQYRVLDLCTGDLGNSAARTFDLEVYAPGVDLWLEVSSVSWCTDYQARRANIRYRPERAAGRPVLVHTLNGSALAWARIWAALVETGPPGRRLGGAPRGARPLPPRRTGHPRRPVGPRGGASGGSVTTGRWRRAQSRGASNR